MKVGENKESHLPREAAPFTRRSLRSLWLNEAHHVGLAGNILNRKNRRVAWTAFVQRITISLRLICVDASSNAKDLSELAQLVEFVARIGFFAPRYNIAPRQQAPVLVQEKGSHRGQAAALGTRAVVGQGRKHRRQAHQRAGGNAAGKAELSQTADVAPLPDTGGRLLRVETQPQRSTPFRFTLKGGRLFCFAGLWERWIRPPRAGEFQFDDGGDEPPPSQVLETFTIITVAANEMMRPGARPDARDFASGTLPLVAGRIRAGRRTDGAVATVRFGRNGMRARVTLGEQRQE